MFYLVAFNFVFCMFAGLLINIFLEAPLMNLIISKQIRTRDREEKFLVNLKQFYAEKSTNNNISPNNSRRETKLRSIDTRQESENVRPYTGF